LQGRPLKYFKSLFTLDGTKILSLLQIPADCKFLVASSDGKFKGLKINKLFDNKENGESFLEKIVN
jgi:hypothetical protein